MGHRSPEHMVNNPPPNKYNSLEPAIMIKRSAPKYKMSFYKRGFVEAEVKNRLDISPCDSSHQDTKKPTSIKIHEKYLPVHTDIVPAPT